MEKLLEMAQKVCDRGEIYSCEYSYTPVTFKNAKLHDIDSTFQSGMSLRMVKDNKLGFAYTRNLINREEFLQNAFTYLEKGVEADYNFPLTKTPPQLDTYDASLENLTNTQMVEECARVCDLLKSKTDGEISVGSYSYLGKIRIINTEGTDISMKRTEYVIYGALKYPGTGSGIWRVYQSKKFEKMPDNIINELIELYKKSSPIVSPKGGKMKVLFMPNSLVTLAWRILSGTSSKSVYEKISPIAKKGGEKIFDEKLTIYDDPLNDKSPRARSFDDEGIACRALTIVENGVLKNFYYDLNYANKLNAKPTGHGYRTAAWGGDSITQKPVPSLSHMTIKPGNKSFLQLVKSIDRGIILEGALGFHSGNIPNGDYSVGVSPGLYVENGEIKGRVKDAMIAGNIYETLKHVVDVGDTLYLANMMSFDGWAPPILCDNVSVVIKN